MWSQTRDMIVRKDNDVIEYVIRLDAEAALLGNLIKVEKNDGEIVLIYQYKKLPPPDKPKDGWINFND
jgi:hypothetical protein